MPAVTMEWESRLGRRLRVRDLYVLSAVVKVGSMAKAARSLSMSQPAVSEAVANLEHLLGVRLLDRGSHGVRPTIYADAILKRSMAVFDELKQGVRDIEALADPTVGELAVGYTNMDSVIFPQIIDRFSKEFPRVVIQADLVQSPAPRWLPSLQDRTYDLVFGRMRLPLPPDDPKQQINREALVDDPLVVVAGAHSPWTRKRKIDLKELAKEPWVLSPRHTDTYARVAAEFAARGVGMPAAMLLTNTLDLRVRLPASGPYITVVPRSALQGHEKGRELKALPVDMRIPWIVTVFTLRNRTLSPVVGRFIDCARDVVRLTGKK
jgi:DNA-binding transcriptional LysR family regulator